MLVDRQKTHLVLFDVDGTLTRPRLLIEQAMIETLQQLRQVNYVGVVGGSDYEKIRQQLGDAVIGQFDFVFSENGLLSHKDGVEFHRQSLKDYLGEKNLQRFLNFTLKELSQIELPIKRGTFIEYRNGMLNISPIGRNCSQQEREEFEQYDNIHQVRKNLISALQKEFVDLKLKFSIGGQISFDVFPIGWDKTYCLQFLDEFTNVHFFGDKTFEGGNDFEIFSHARTQGYQVNSPAETIKYVTDLFLTNR